MTPVSRRSELSRVLILTHQRFIMLDALLYYVQKCDLGLLCERAKESTELPFRNPVQSYNKIRNNANTSVTRMLRCQKVF